MTVNFNPNIAFKSQTQPVKLSETKPIETKETIPAEQADTFKKSSSLKEYIGNVAKSFTTLSEMNKASVKAVAYGALTACAFLVGGWLFGALPRGFKKGNSLKQVFTNPIKTISTEAKVLTGIASVVAAGYQIVKGKLRANQRTANIDHQLNIGHREA